LNPAARTQSEQQQNRDDAGTPRRSAAAAQTRRYGDVWLPSQSGASLVFLQPQKNTIPVLSALKGSGLKLVPSWLPSQKGWFALFPQEHQA
jgi:hypothetical protein